MNVTLYATIIQIPVRAAPRAGLYSGRPWMESVAVSRIFMFVYLLFEYAGYLRAEGSPERKDKYGYGL